MSIKEITFLALLIATAFCIPKQQPVIGIYTQSDDSDEPTLNGQYRTSAQFQTYIAASYVKYIEMSGAHVVPIFAYSEQSKIAALLPKLNGVLFPGGGQEFNINKRWTSNADFILKYAKSQNDKGNVYPVWGTCLGLQLLSYLTANYEGVLSAVRGQTAILNTIQFPSSKGYLFGDMPEKVTQKVTNGQGIVYYNHHYAVLKSTYLSNSRLNSFWTVTGETTTPYNELFVTVMEAKKYPFYAVQFHPEKSIFEWKVYADKSYDSMQLVQTLSNKFVEQARKNTNTMDASELEGLNIWNYQPQTTKMSFSRIYLFNETKPAEDLVAPSGQHSIKVANPENPIFEHHWRKSATE